MKLFKYLLGILLIFSTYSISPTTINGRFQIIKVDVDKISVSLQINTTSVGNDLGGTTIVLSFDTTSVSFTNTPIKGVDYIFHNFDDGSYSPATVTRPMNNKIWINIDLPYVNNNNGTIVAGSPEWTDVVTIRFDVVDANRSSNLTWLTTSPFWGIYDGDNSTIWQTGEFNSYPTSVEPGSKLPTNFELSQNYPNPFNPSTKIRYSIPSNLAYRQAGVKGQMSKVKLIVYDVLGNEVATLVDEEKEPGVYEVEFSTSRGESSIASGIYIYRLQSGDPSTNQGQGQSFVETKKMVLLK